MRSFLVLGFLMVYLSGCSILNQRTAETRAIEDRQAELASLTQWQAGGRILLNASGEASNVAMQWQQNGADFNVALTGPLGLRLLHAEQKGETATLQVRGQRPVSGKSVETLVRSRLNLPIPMSQFSFWLRGMPGTGESPQWDEFGRLQALDYRDEQGNLWKASISNYSLVENIDLPSLITVKNRRDEIQVSLKKWLIGAPALVPDEPRPARRLAIPGVS